MGIDITTYRIRIGRFGPGRGIFRQALLKSINLPSLGRIFTIIWFDDRYGSKVFSQYHPHPHPWPEGQGHGLGSLVLKFIVVKCHSQMKGQLMIFPHSIPLCPII